MKWALIDPNEIIINIIVYDGVSPYTPEGGIILSQVNDWLNIGDNINSPEPSPEL